jgi:hypothetical protein
MTTIVPLPATRVVETPDWRSWVTPRPLRQAPIHRWFVFPHSFSAEIVQALVAEWNLGSADLLVDPFVGAGTTLVAAQDIGVPAFGCDLSPLSAFATRAKTARPSAGGVQRAWATVRRQLGTHRPLPPTNRGDHELLSRAFEPRTLAVLEAAYSQIVTVVDDPAKRDVLILALLGVLPRFSKLVSKGGWLAQTQPLFRSDEFAEAMSTQVAMIRTDLENATPPKADACACVADARWLPLPSNAAAGIITSPPYLNRHDYTRVFGVELAFGFLDEQKTKALRYQSFASHPEARPRRPDLGGYREPDQLTALIAEIASRITDRRESWRIPTMLTGYFQDLYCSTREIARVLRPGATAAMVVGNVRYCGVALEVDRFLCEIAVQAGLVPREVRIARLRGNSAQQMGLYGREPARESVVLLTKALQGGRTHVKV